MFAVVLIDLVLSDSFGETLDLANQSLFVVDTARSVENKESFKGAVFVRLHG